MSERYRLGTRENEAITPLREEDQLIFTASYRTGVMTGYRAHQSAETKRSMDFLRVGLSFEYYAQRCFATLCIIGAE